MESRGDKSLVDYKSIGTKMLSGEVLNDAEKSAFFSVALNFANNLVEEKINQGVLTGLSMRSDEVRKRSEVVTLGRIFSLREKAVKADLQKADSVIKFDALKGHFAGVLGVDVEVIGDAILFDLINEQVEKELDKDPSNEIVSNMDFIRKVGSLVIADNPSVASGPGIEHKLD